MKEHLPEYIQAYEGQEDDVEPPSACIHQQEIMLDQADNLLWWNNCLDGWRERGG